jgi:hypothetical protein
MLKRLSRLLSWQLTLEECDRLNPPILEIAEGEDGALYHKVVDDSYWLDVGYIPTPQTVLGWFIYHLIHGLVMGYPVHKVVIFSIVHAWQSE